MRKFKFRAWNEFQMLSDKDLRKTAEELYTETGKSGQYENCIIIPNCEDIVVMQYTGFKDKNEKEIYENDIVKFLDEVTVKEEGYLDRTSVVEKVGVVVWDNEELGYNVDVKFENEYHYLCCCEEVEVIGNIYENPELLK